MRSRHDVIIWAMLALGLAITFCFTIVPVLSGVWLSLYRADSYVSESSWVGLENYGRVLHDPLFWRAAANGCTYAVLSILFQVTLGLTFAVVLDTKFPFRGLVRGLIILPYLLPTVVAALIFQWMTDSSFGAITSLADQAGLSVIAWFDTPTGAMASVTAVSTWLWTPFVTVCCLASMQAIPPSLYEAARVDGAYAIDRFWEITLPQIMPVLSSVVLLRAVWMFNKFDIIWLLTKGGPLGSTEHIPILAYRRAFDLFDVGGGAAVATLSFLSLAVVVTLYLSLIRLEPR